MMCQVALQMEQKMAQLNKKELVIFKHEKYLIMYSTFMQHSNPPSNWRCFN